MNKASAPIELPIAQSDGVGQCEHRSRSIVSACGNRSPAIPRGALQQLTRAELLTVVAHVDGLLSVADNAGKAASVGRLGQPAHLRGPARSTAKHEAVKITRTAFRHPWHAEHLAGRTALLKART